MNNSKINIVKEENLIELYLDERIYNLVVIKKALFNYIEDCYYMLDHFDENIILVKIYLKDQNTNIDEYIKKLYNELFNESLRYDIMIQTKNIRELILGRALYTTCIDTDENTVDYDNNDKNHDINEIAVNWFDKNRGQEC
ncbi:MAG: His-Xaa-Ser system protein HxsD [Clostridia bacterium]|nr:His-Xaa-Ser system protein HxsD [Clostridia bacterium]